MATTVPTNPAGCEPNCRECEPSGYQLTAAELRRVADALDTLPPGDKPPYVSLSILPERTAEAVDAVAMAVLGKPGKAEKIGSDWFHLVRHHSLKTSVQVTVQTSIPRPPDKRDAEIEGCGLTVVGSMISSAITRRPRRGGVGNGEQKLYRFDNGYGASVVRFDGSYGAESGLWELAVLEYGKGDHYELTYDTPITDDVVGYLTDDEVQDYLRRIRALPSSGVIEGEVVEPLPQIEA